MFYQDNKKNLKNHPSFETFSSFSGMFNVELAPLFFRSSLKRTEKIGLYSGMKRRGTLSNFTNQFTKQEEQIFDFQIPYGKIGGSITFDKDKSILSFSGLCEKDKKPYALGGQYSREKVGNKIYQELTTLVSFCHREYKLKVTPQMIDLSTSLPFENVHLEFNNQTFFLGHTRVEGEQFSKTAQTKIKQDYSFKNQKRKVELQFLDEQYECLGPPCSYGYWGDSSNIQFETIQEHLQKQDPSYSSFLEHFIYHFNFLVNHLYQNMVLTCFKENLSTKEQQVLIGIDTLSSPNQKLTKKKCKLK